MDRRAFGILERVGIVMIVAAIGILALAGWFVYAKRRRRRDDLGAIARGYGFSHDPGDARSMLDNDLPLFALGSDRGIENT
ncbi:MAG: hypothetical protein LC808_11100, partial [Actinobacteria bacterium]|nr:hypothetical protein [Actinomycetota bacterium]